MLVGRTEQTKVAAATPGTLDEARAARLETVRRGAHLLVAALVASVPACIPARWTLSNDGGSDASSDVIETNAPEDAALDVGGLDGFTLDDAAPTHEAGPAPTDAADAPFDAPFDAPDAPDAFDAEPALDAALDVRAVRYTLPASDPRPLAPLGALPDPSSGPEFFRTFRCNAGQLFNSISQFGHSDPSPVTSVAEPKFLVHTMDSTGRTAGPISSPPHLNDRCDINLMSAGGTVVDRCPPGFVLVGLQGDESVLSGSSRILGRLAPVCARLSAWVRMRESSPDRGSPFFRAAVDPSPPMGTGDAAVEDVPEPYPGSSDTYPRLYSCVRPEGLPDEVNACSFPYRSGNGNAQTVPPQPRAFFSVCAGGSVVVGFDANRGCLLERLQLFCRPVVVE